MKSIFSYFCCLLFYCSCTPKVAIESSVDLPPIFPDYISAYIPNNIAPLNFEVEDASYIRADISANKEPLTVLTGKSSIQMPVKQWKDWLTTNKGKTLEITVSVWSDRYPQGICYAPFSVYISPNEIDEWIAYRLIEPGYEYWNQMGIYQRNLSSFIEKPIVTNDQNHQGCLNCHAFHDYSPGRMMFHARGKNGTTVLVKENIPERVAFEKLTDEVKATYPMWHHSGNYIAFSSNQTHQSFYHHGKMPVEVYDVASDLFIYDVNNNKVLTDKRFTEETRFETFPGFSPDGKSLYYCVADARTMPQENRDLKYALCRVPFDELTGSLGEQVDTIYHPAIQGGSVSFPRISPDGQYLLYTEAASATFPIWHKEADLKMLRLTDGQEVNTDILNSDETESYHSWSSNGKWIIYSSRRIDGRYTRLYIAGINDDGVFQKPFLLPQKSPLHNTTRLTSYNIPEFIKEEVKLDKRKIKALFE